MHELFTDEPSNTGDNPDPAVLNLHEEDTNIEGSNIARTSLNKPRKPKILWFLTFILTFAVGLGSGYLIWDVGILQKNKTLTSADLMSQINPSDGYPLPVTYGDIGPGLLSAGAIEYDTFLQVYTSAGQPINDEQKDILTKGSSAQIVFTTENAYFLLNYFWALGLVNDNPILMEGPMMQYGPGQMGRFASTGGWTIGAKSATELFASAPLLTLTPEQQARLENVAQNVYRPCCNNSTYFPDCNHGMAMLGLLSQLASEDASETEMFEAAKYANAFWYPQQYFELALYFNAVDGQEFTKVDAQKVVSSDISSSAGFGKVHQTLSSNGLLEQAPGSGNRCGV